MSYTDLRAYMTRFLLGEISKRELAAAFALWQEGGAFA